MIWIWWDFPGEKSILHWTRTAHKSYSSRDEIFVGKGYGKSVFFSSGSAYAEQIVRDYFRTKGINQQSNNLTKRTKSELVYLGFGWIIASSCIKTNDRSHKLPHLVDVELPAPKWGMARDTAESSTLEMEFQECRKKSEKCETNVAAATAGKLFRKFNFDAIIIIRREEG